MLALAFPLADRNHLVWRNVLSQLNIPQDFGYVEWNLGRLVGWIDLCFPNCDTLNILNDWGGWGPRIVVIC